MDSDIGKIIQRVRKDKGFTQKELAEKLGVSTGTVQQWELGVRYPRLIAMKRLESVLGISLINDDETQIYERDHAEQIRMAWDAAEKKAGRQLTLEEAMEYYKINTSDHIRINKAVHKLNMEGMRLAAELLEALTEAPKFTLPVIDKQGTTFHKPFVDDNPTKDTPE